MLWQCLSLGVYLASLGCGVYYQLRYTSSWKRLLHLELLLACVGVLAVPTMLFLHGIYRIYFFDTGTIQTFAPINLFALMSLLVIASVAFLAGQEFPILFNLVADKNSKRIPILLCMTYLGALLASIVFGAVFLEHTSLVEAGAWTASINFIIAIYILTHLKSESFKAPVFSSLASALLILLIYFSATDMEQLSLKNFYLNRLSVSYSPERGTYRDGPVGLMKLREFAANAPEVRRVRSPYQSLDFVTRLYDRETFTLYLNGHYQFETQREKEYHDVMSTSPILAFHSKVKRALVLGGGDGLLVRDLLQKVPELEYIRLVELDAKMIEEAKKSPLRDVNLDALKDPRVHVSIADAFHWLRRSEEEDFDAVYVDFPYPHDGETLRLYSMEFYKLAARKIHPDGFLIADYPIYAFQNGKDAVTAQSFFKAGFQKTWWARCPGESFVIASLKERTVHEEDLGEIKFLELQKPDQAEYRSLLKPRKMMKPDRFF